MHARTLSNIRRLLFAALTLSLLFVSAAASSPESNIFESYQGGGDAAGPIYQFYVVRFGDTLALIAARFGVSLQSLMAANGLRNANLIYAGQTLRIPLSRSAPALALPKPPVVQGPIHDGPADKLIPDSEAVYSPAYADFDVDAFIHSYPSYLASYREEIDGEILSGAQIIQIISERFSVGPRVLLTALETQSSWVTGQPANLAQQNYPMGIEDRIHTGLYYQTWWAANFLNAGYYGKLLSRMDTMALRDNSHVRFAASVNPGTAGVQNMLSHMAGYDGWLNLIGANGFKTTYQKLFGDPFANAIEPLVSPDVKQPALRLPFANGELWYLTGGPHGAWADGSAWAAVDFSPPGRGGCIPSAYWAIAAAAGHVVRTEHGRVMLNLDGYDFQGKGWTLMYMHMGSAGRVAQGAMLNVGDPIGHPSCEGGYSSGLHLHIARLYNGQWMSVASQAAFEMSGWVFKNASREYDGTMVRAGEVHEAYNGRIDRINGVTGDTGPSVARVAPQDDAVADR